MRLALRQIHVTRMRVLTVDLRAVWEPLRQILLRIPPELLKAQQILARRSLGRNRDVHLQHASSE
jgi:hypothetical protein